MHIKNPIRGTLFALSLLPGLVLAYGPDSAKTHMGTLNGVDSGNGTFSIIDAETRANLTFHAAPDLLDELSGASGMVSVRYEALGDTLTAIDVSR